MTVRSRPWLLALALIALAMPAYAQSVQREQLATGLTLVIAEFHSTPTVEVRVTVRASPLTEGPLLGSGASVLLQRLLVSSGNATQGPDDLVRALARLGNRFHAETTVAASSYALSTTGDRVADAIALLAGMVGNYQYTQVDLQRERQALMAPSPPSADLLEGLLLNSLLYRQHPARLPVHGMPRMMDQLTVELMKRYQAARCTAPNTVVTVVGNVNTNEVRRWIEQAFSHYSVGGYQPTAPYLEPPQFGPRYASGQIELAQPRLAIAWRTDSIEHPNQPALRVLARLLGDSVLPRAFAARDLAVTARVENRLMVDQPGALVIGFASVPAARADAERTVYAALDTLITDGPQADEVAAAKRQLRVADAERLATARGICEELERWELATGDPAYGRIVADQQAGVSAEDLVRVAKRYLGDGAARACTVALRAGGEPAVGAGRIAEPTGSIAPEVIDLGRGLRLLARPAQEAPLVHLRLTFAGGSAAEDPDLPGSATVLAEVLTGATTNRSRDEIAALCRRTGMTVTADSDAHQSGVALTCLPEDLDSALGLLVDLLTRPALAQDDLDQARSRALRRRDVRDADPRRRLIDATRQVALAGHYAARDQLGGREVLARLDRAALQALHQRLATTGNVVLSLAGRFERTAAVSTLGRLLGERPPLRAGAALAIAAPPVAAVPAPLSVIYHDGPGAGVAVAWPGPALAARAEDEAPVAVLMAILAGVDAPGGRLGRVLVAGPAAPSAVAVREAWLGRGLCQVVATGDEASIDPLQQVVRDQVVTLLAQLDLPAEDPKALPEAEVATAKAMCAVACALAEEDVGATTRRHATALLIGANLEREIDFAARVAAVGVADLRRVARAWFAGDPVIVVDKPRRGDQTALPAPVLPLALSVGQP